MWSDLFRPHEAARAYASAAAVLAGFCFAAVVFIVGIQQGTSNFMALARVQAEAQAFPEAIANVDATAKAAFLQRVSPTYRHLDLARLKQLYPGSYDKQLVLARKNTRKRAKHIADAQSKQLEAKTLGPKSFDRAIGALLTAFVGLVISSLLMARVGARAGTEDPDRRGVGGDPIRRTLWLVLLGSTGLATSGLFALWGLAELVDVVFKDNGAAITLVWLVFVATSILAAAFVTAAASDLRAAEAARPGC